MNIRYPIYEGVYRILTFKLHLYSEVKAISGRLGGKYRHIEELILKIDNDDL